jgi:hypothetical protein
MTEYASIDTLQMRDKLASTLWTNFPLSKIRYMKKRSSEKGPTFDYESILLVQRFSQTLAKISCRSLSGAILHVSQMK